MISWTWVRIRFYNFKQDKFCWMGVMVLVKGKWKESEVISKRSRLSIPATKVSSVSFSQYRAKFLDLHSMVRKKIYQGNFFLFILFLFLSFFKNWLCNHFYIFYLDGFLCQSATFYLTTIKSQQIVYILINFFSSTITVKRW